MRMPHRATGSQAALGLSAWPLAALVMLAFAARPVLAHVGAAGDAAETRFAFPPWVVWAAGALVVAVSFAVVGLFLTRAAGHATSSPVSPAATHAGFTPLRFVGLAAWAVIIGSAFLPAGVSDLALVIWWLGIWTVLPLLAYTVGDVWPRISPFAALGPLADRLRGKGPPEPLPALFSGWPVAALLLTVVALEANGTGPAESAHAAGVLLLAYTVLTFLGMAFFGAEVWLGNAEVITVMLRAWRAASPLSWQSGVPRWRAVTGPLARLPVRGVGDVAFVVALLYAVNADGFLSTALGHEAARHLAWLHVPAPRTLLVVAGFLAFLGAFVLTAKAVQRAADDVVRWQAVAARFVPALLPIAVGYHLAHHLVTAVEASPRLLAALADPFAVWGLGASLGVSLTLPASWNGPVAAFQVLAILVGHVVAVVVAHRLAAMRYASGEQALRGEIPLTLVMVAYTWTGLWILSGAGGGG